MARSMNSTTEWQRSSNLGWHHKLKVPGGAEKRGALFSSIYLEIKAPPKVPRLSCGSRTFSCTLIPSLITLPAQDSQVSPSHPATRFKAKLGGFVPLTGQRSLSPGSFCVTLKEAAVVIALGREESCLFPL